MTALLACVEAIWLTCKGCHTMPCACHVFFYSGGQYTGQQSPLNYGHRHTGKPLPLILTGTWGGDLLPPQMNLNLQ